MADAFKILGQAIPAATTLTDVYTVTTGAMATVSTVTFCNQSANATTVRMAVAVAGAANTPAQYVVMDASVRGNDTLTLTIGMTLGSTDVLRGYSANGQVSINVFGVEVQ
jgi:hypothetical protein